MREKRERSREQGTDDHHKDGPAQSACVSRKSAPEWCDESHDSNDNPNYFGIEDELFVDMSGLALRAERQQLAGHVHQHRRTA
jgi:hypothetical protein